MNFKSKIIITNEELANHYKEIEELFHKSFGRQLDKKVWHWAYIDNACGPPIVSLYFDKEKLIGHYAIIPMRLNSQQGIIKAGLSMTTMVDSSYRKYGLFVKQASEVYEKAKEMGYGLVFGFPNKNSTPGFKKRLDWIIDDTCYVARVLGREIKRYKLISQGNVYFDTQDESLLQWRLSKPGQHYIVKSKDLIIKRMGNDYDIVFANDFKELEDESYYNLLTSSSHFYSARVFDYYFGLKVINPSLSNLTLKKDLILSDVF